MRVLQMAIVRFNICLSLIKIRHRYNESRVKYIFVNGFKEFLENHFLRNKENNNYLYTMYWRFNGPYEIIYFLIIRLF